MSYLIVYYGNDIKLIIKEVNLLYLPLIFLLSLLQYFLSAWRWHFIASKTRSSQLIENEFQHIETYAKLLETICEINVTKGC